MRILVLEDHEGTRFALEVTLEGEGHEVVSFASGESALEHLKNERVDCILMDWNMPGISGTDFIRAVKELSIEPFRAQIGVLSGERRILPTAPQLGCDFFLMKPYSPIDLFTELAAGA